TVVSPAYVVPEHFEEYTLRVPEHFEKRRVFVPGYEGYTHVKIYHPYSAYEIPGSFTISFQGLILEAEGVKVYTSFLPIADEGFELRVIPKEVTLNIYGDVLVGPLIPVQGLQTTVPVKYVVKSVEPAFEEKLVKEDEAGSILKVTGCGEVTAPEGYEVTLASKRVVRKPLWVDIETYRRLQQEGFGRMREGCYWYEDGNKEEWPSSDAICEATPLEREIFANRIVLVYHPLQETPLESTLVRGLWLRNYATQDIDYTVTVEPVTLPPEKPENTALKAEKACCKELSVFLFANTTFWIRLNKGDRLVAELFLPKLLILPFPFSLQWWRGFIIGLVERSPRIMMNTMMLSTVAMVPRELMPAIAAALGFMKAYQVYNQRGEIFNATTALGNLTAMGLIYRGMADGYRLQGKNGFAAICDNLSQTFFEGAKEVAADLGLRLVMDVTLEDVKTALGWRKASEYEQGYATGKIVGAMVEAVTYAATFATIYHEFSTARDMLTMAGEAGRISASSVLKRFAQGLYTWVTPAVWDLAETGIRFGAWLKGKLNLRDVSKLIFADQVSKDFGETVGRAFETLPDGGEPDEIAKGVSNIVDRVTSDNDVPESVGARILRILSRIGEEYFGKEDWGAKAEQATEIIVEAWERVSELEAWRKGGEPGKLLIDLLEGMKASRAEETLDVLQRIKMLEDEELENVGRVLTVNPNIEMLRLVLEEPGRLEELLDGIKSFDFSEEPRGVKLKKGEPAMLNMGEANKLKPGTYKVWVYWEYDKKSGVMEFPITREVESDQVNIPKDQVNKALDEIGSDEAKTSVTRAEFIDYRFFFPTEFSVGIERIGLNLFSNEMKIGGKSYWFIPNTGVWGGKLHVDAEFQCRNEINGKTLTLSFYDNGEVRIKFSVDYSLIINEIKVNTVTDLMAVKYGDNEARYSFNLKPLSEQIGKHSYEKPLKEGQARVGLKEELFELLGYDALKELEEGMGSKYGIIVKYDNGEKKYCGSSMLVASVPEGASSIKEIAIISKPYEPIEPIEPARRLEYSLHKIIEAIEQNRPLNEVAEYIGYVGEYAMYSKYQDKFTSLIFQKAGVPQEQFDQLKGKIVYEWYGTNIKGGEVTDILMKATEEITLGETTFYEGDVIAIIEVKSTTDIDYFGDRFSVAKSDLKKHIGLDKYKTAQYGIAVSFAFDPVDMLWDGTYPGNVGFYSNPHMELFTRSEIESFGG
ncbi:MAG: hypothetical protein QXI42_12065, partial [Thermoproteota archaeon]